MVAKNDITGDSIQSRASSKAFEEGIERIFNKEEERERKAREKAEYFAKLNAETQKRMDTKLEDGFDLESLDPAERSWYYDDHGVRRKKEVITEEGDKEVRIKTTLNEVRIKGSV